MAGRDYWLDLFTGTTWEEFLAAGGEISGFREARKKTVQRIVPGDYLLCYLTGVSRFIGVLEVTSEAFDDNSPIWKDEDFPCRLCVKVVVKLIPETAVPIRELKDRLTIFQNLENPHAWTGYVRGSPAKWPVEDGKEIVEAIFEAERNPVHRPVDPAKLRRRPRALKAKLGSVTIPEGEEAIEGREDQPTPSDHSEIQWLLLKLGNEMGFDLWVARNDRGRVVSGQRLGDFPRCISELPVQFDDATNKTIELIDVLWLKGNAIIAAFEIESTTSIYSGLLRMSDLLSMQPNINIPLYLVAPEERREKVIAEINRPTFTGLKPQLSEICRYLSFRALREGIQQVEGVVSYLRPEFLEEMSESCEVEEV